MSGQQLSNTMAAWVWPARKHSCQFQHELFRSITVVLLYPVTAALAPNCQAFCVFVLCAAPQCEVP